MTLKLCRDCKHFGESYMPSIPLCFHPSHTTTDPVRGAEISDTYCYSSRREGKSCGPQGQLWEEREKPPTLLGRLKGWVGGGKFHNVEC